MYWARQIEARYPKYLFRRLSVFACEDIGIADPQAIVIVNAAAWAYAAAKESRAPRPDPALIGFTVLYMAMAPKNREGDDLVQAVVHAVEEGWRPEIPDEALDLHTAEGRARIAQEDRLRHWLDEASHSENERGTRDWKLWIRRWAARRGRLDPEQVEREAEEWENEGRLRWGRNGAL